MKSLCIQSLLTLRSGQKASSVMLSTSCGVMKEQLPLMQPWLTKSATEKLEDLEADSSEDVVFVSMDAV